MGRSWRSCGFVLRLVPVRSLCHSRTRGHVALRCDCMNEVKSLKEEVLLPLAPSCGSWGRDVGVCMWRLQSGKTPGVLVGPVGRRLV